MDADLFGPDDEDRSTAEIEEVGDRIAVWSRQFVNRWVYQTHQRPAALAELERLIAAARERQ